MAVDDLEGGGQATVPQLSLPGAENTPPLAKPHRPEQAVAHAEQPLVAQQAARAGVEQQR